MDRQEEFEKEKILSKYDLKNLEEMVSDFNSIGQHKIIVRRRQRKYETELDFKYRLKQDILVEFKIICL